MNTESTNKRKELELLFTPGVERLVPSPSRIQCTWLSLSLVLSLLTLFFQLFRAGFRFSTKDQSSPNSTLRKTKVTICMKTDWGRGMEGGGGNVAFHSKHHEFQLLKSKTVQRRSLASVARKLNRKNLRDSDHSQISLIVKKFCFF